MDVTDRDHLERLSAERTKPVPAGVKALIFAAELAFVSGLLMWWLSSETIRESKSLWVLFLYCFPAEFLIAPVPHEPIILYFGKFYVPLTVALVAIAGTALTEAVNYSVFRYAADMRLFRKTLQSRAVQKTMPLFQKAPFLALWVAGFTPVPFYPFRFLVVLARYPLWKYLLAVILSRTPRFYILALFGKAVEIPDRLLIALFAVLIAAANFPIIKKYLKKRKDTGKDDPAQITHHIPRPTGRFF